MNLRPLWFGKGGFCSVLGLGLTCFYCVFTALGQMTNYVVDQFDTDTTHSYHNQDWGTAVPIITWDDTTNATTSLGPNNPGSGSAQWVVPWTTTNDQIEVTRVFNNGTVLNLSNFSIVSFDIMFATNSATDGAGSYGALEVDCIPQGVGWPSTAMATYTSAIASGSGWIHVSLPVNTSLAITGIGFKIQQSRTGGNLSGTMKFWIDNIMFSGYTTPPITGPPQIIQLNTARLWQMLQFQITNAPVNGNPFDLDSIRLDGTFTLPSGETMAVPAFWYQGYTRSLSGGTEQDTVSGPLQWRLRFTPPEAGDYSLSLAIETNDHPYATVVTNFAVVSNTPPARFGYVGIAPNNQYFQTGDGKALPLIGEDVASPSPTSLGTYDYDNWFAAMHNAGENFARVFMTPQSFGIEDAPGTLNSYALDPAWQLDYVLQLAEQKGIYLQLCLDTSAMYSSVTNYWGAVENWPTNPYNSANGGPCVNPNAFFTNSTAKIIYQKRLRYLVARYGYSQNLLSWEFFNEIDHDYAAVSGLPASVSVNPTDCGLWHADMGNWLDINDPYHHLITTSMTYVSQGRNVWSLPQISYTCEHLYGTSNPATALASDAQSMLATYGKPVMVAEYGTGWQSWEYEANDPYYRGFREGIWGGALGGTVGTAMPWWWVNVDNAGLYYAFSSLETILNQAGWGSGQWTNVVFQGQSPNAVGLRSSQESLIYLVAADAAWPTDATNTSLPVQQGQTVTLTDWHSGTYYADWYDPATATYLGRSQANASNGSLTFSLPNFNVDLAGIINPPPPTLTVPVVNQNGSIQFQLNSEVGGIYDIESSTDLLNWVTCLTVTNTQGAWVVTNLGPITSSAMFFRAKQSQ